MGLCVFRFLGMHRGVSILDVALDWNWADLISRLAEGCVVDRGVDMGARDNQNAQSVRPFRTKNIYNNIRKMNRR